MIFLVDIDNTLRNTWYLYRHTAQYLLKGTSWPEDWQEEGPSDYWFLKAQHDHPRIKLLEQLWNKKGLHGDALPYPGAVECMNKLADYGDVFFVTSPVLSNETVHSENRQWVEDHFGKVWLPQLIQTHDKTVVHGDILIDDKPTITGVQQFPAWKHILFDQPYNRHERKPRIFNWHRVEEVLKYV